MNLYYDSEFTGLHQSTSLISLALVADDGREFYAEFNDYQRAQCDDWIKQQVLQYTRWLNNGNAQTGYWEAGQLSLCHGDTAYIRAALVKWLADYESIEIWADCLAWDWVLFCQIFGGALHIPPSIFYLPFDLVTLLKAKGHDANLDRESFANVRPDGSTQDHRHNALHDARVLQACYHKLMQTDKIDSQAIPR